MATQLDHRSQRILRDVFFFCLLSSSVSSCYCLGMPQFWHQRSEVARSQEPCRSLSPMHCCTVTVIHHLHRSLSLGPDTAVTHMHVNIQSCIRGGQTHTFITGGSSPSLACLGPWENSRKPRTASEVLYNNKQQNNEAVSVVSCAHLAVVVNKYQHLDTKSAVWADLQIWTSKKQIQNKQV